MTPWIKQQPPPKKQQPLKKLPKLPKLPKQQQQQQKQINLTGNTLECSLKIIIYLYRFNHTVHYFYEPLYTYIRKVSKYWYK